VITLSAKSNVKTGGSNFLNC